MPTSILGEVDDLPDAAWAQGRDGPSDHPGRSADPVSRPDSASRSAGSALRCPSCGSSHVAQMLGDNGGVSFVCTACGHSWS